MDITSVELMAAERSDANYFLNKGADLYNDGKYKKAMEYYEVAAGMGHPQAVSNLGYCYLYGRGVSKDEKKAFLYFSIAASRENIDGLYKMATFYLRWECRRKRMRKSQMYLLEKAVEYAEDLDEYPSLALTLSKEYMKRDEVDTFHIFVLLSAAKFGYEREIEENGAIYYQKYLDEVDEILEEPQYQEIIRDIQSGAFEDDGEQ